MSSTTLPNISSDLIWEIVRKFWPSWQGKVLVQHPFTDRKRANQFVFLHAGDNNSFLVKSKRNGGVQFSRDPFNLLNKNTRKHAGFVNDKVRLKHGTDEAREENLKLWTY